jgi:hypothetical protein
VTNKELIAELNEAAEMLSGTAWRRLDGGLECSLNANLAMKAADALEAAEAEIERLRGLLWFAWAEFNAISARDGAPRAACPNDPQLVSEEWWSQMRDAFADAIGDDAQKPWPSTEAETVLAALTSPAVSTPPEDR